MHRIDKTKQDPSYYDQKPDNRQKKYFHINFQKDWCLLPDSNRRSGVLEALALTAKLRRRLIKHRTQTIEEFAQRIFHSKTSHPEEV